VRDRIPVALLAHAEWRAAALGVGADRVLVAGGTLPEDDYLRAYARTTRIPFEPLDLPRYACPLTDARLLEAAGLGLVPLAEENGEIALVVAPRGMAARRLALLIERTPALRRYLRVTSARRLTDFVMRHCRKTLGAHAADALRDALPLHSAAPRPRSGRAGLRCATAGAAASALALAAPDATLLAITCGASLLFLSWMTLRVLGLFIRPQSAPPIKIADADLPTYTVIVALYREAAAVAGLVKSLQEFDWPPEKLDVKLVVEPDDHATRAAIARLTLPPHFEVIVAPAVGPRTKPKALNAALPFAQGAFTAIYDAEDRPDPDQLRAALDVFLRNDDRLACVQAALTIDNTADSWLARTFTAEYAAHFDLLLPSLAALRLPLPLGGSSNHFRTDVLRAIGAWDAYNVTEDADLGMRLARFGYRSAVIASTTYEEAPAQCRPWLRQRTRWFKGWIQTWLVHMRAPAALWRELGPAGFIVLQLVVGGNVLAALILPAFLALVVARLFAGVPVFDGGVAGLHMLALIGGVAITAVSAAVGLARRRLLSSAWIVGLMPLHWGLLSVAAWRGLIQVLRDPYRWEKTEHGLARSSRRAQQQDMDAWRRLRTLTLRR
jgi:cellulose synthase/poly-beta-1,6-N-acetylglucosamine synthase-like glycosyltransferase